MKILVTGAAGYIGSVLCRALVHLRYNVVGVDNFLYDNQQALLPLLNLPNFKCYHLDVNSDKVVDAYKQADVIFPLAAVVGAPACDRDSEYAVRTNHQAISTMVDNLSKHQRVIFPNTNSGYGIGGETCCTESSPLNPLSLYGKSKCAAEAEVLSHPNSVSLRLATVCGVSPRMRFDLMVNHFCLELLFLPKGETFKIYEPHFKRNFVHIMDVVRAMIFMMENYDLEGVYNVGNPLANMTKLELAETIRHYYDMEPGCIEVGAGEDVDKRDYVVSSEKIISAGFRFEHYISDAFEEIRQLVGWYNTKEELEHMSNVV